jgi:hypothetical protein
MTTFKLRKLTYNWCIGINIIKWEQGYWCFRLGFWKWIGEWIFRKET